MYVLDFDNALSPAVETSSRPCVLLFFPLFWISFYFILFFYCFNFVYMKLACKELSLLSLQINSGFPQGIQDDNWYQNRAHLNNYVFKLQYINVTQNAIRSVSQQHSPLKYPVSPISVTKRGKEEHVIE